MRRAPRESTSTQRKPTGREPLQSKALRESLDRARDRLPPSTILCPPMTELVVSFDRLRMSDVDQVGGKNASLGEMIGELAGKGVRVPGGFATTAEAFREFLRDGGLDRRIAARLEGLDVNDIGALTAAGREIRGWIVDQPLPAALQKTIAGHYETLSGGGAEGASFAVRSSATAEDLPDASFAGQQETFLNINGLENILQAIRQVFASLYNDRAIAYRVHRG